MRITRRLIQLGFLALTVVGVFYVRGHAERWCPFGGVEALYGYLRFGEMTCSLHVSNFFILGGVLLSVVLLRRAFCGWVCPIGTISEWLFRINPFRRRRRARAPGRPAPGPDRVPYWVDRSLALLKYAVLGVILYFTWTVGELVFRGYDPCYALISRHGTDIQVWAYVISGAVVLGSLLVAVPFCRWLCPLAAVFTPFSRVGLARVTRHADACADCGACNRACPMNIRVDRAGAVTAARCTSCLECVAACPPNAAALTWGPPRWLGRRWPQFAIVPLLLACLGGAVAASYLAPLPSFVYARGEAPGEAKSVEMQIRGVDCRHSTQRFWAFLTERDDELRVRGYLKLEAWPAPHGSAVCITFDPTATSEAQIKEAIVAPQFDDRGAWALSPYRIEGYEPE